MYCIHRLSGGISTTLTPRFNTLGEVKIYLDKLIARFTKPVTKNFRYSAIYIPYGRKEYTITSEGIILMDSEDNSDE